MTAFSKAVTRSYKLLYCIFSPLIYLKKQCIEFCRWPIYFAELPRAQGCCLELTGYKQSKGQGKLALDKIRCQVWLNIFFARPQHLPSELMNLLPQSRKDITLTHKLAEMLQKFTEFCSSTVLKLLFRYQHWMLSGLQEEGMALCRCSPWRTFQTHFT